MSTKHKLIKVASTYSLLLLAVVFPNCTKLVTVDPPVTATTGATVFNSDQTAIAVLTNQYTSLSESGVYGGNVLASGSNGVSSLAGLSADELSLYFGFPTGNSFYFYYTNTLLSNASRSFGTELWPSVYNLIYGCNSAIEGLSNSTTLTPAVKRQLTGEARFLRAFYYFYLVNLYGDIPLLTSSDFKANASLARTPASQVYDQIITDLKASQLSLSDNYLDGTLLTNTIQRVRPTKWAATALLARTYLYKQNWDSAEAQATAVIDNSSLFNLDSLNGVFLANSTEAIWQLQPVNAGHNTEDAILFILNSTGPNPSQPVYLSNSLLNSFEANDLRRVQWIDSVIVAPTTFYYAYKYKSATLGAPVTEYLMALRLGEQYLIRAEARAEQNNISGAQEDLNMIRKRAGLGNTTATDQPSVLLAIMHERQIEMFSEWGHRWLDLKRTGNIDAVMSIVCPQKGSTWQSYQQLYPIPHSELILDKNLIQNAGY